VAAGSLGQRALESPTLHRPAWLASAAACGLGILTKGPVALLLAPVPLVLGQRLCGLRGKAGWAAWLGYAGTAAAVAGPWYLAVARTEPAYLQDFLWTHNIRRFLAPLDHQQPLWYYFPAVIVSLLPWTLLLPGVLRWQWRRRRRPAFFLVCLAWCVLFFSASGCKRPAYILPALPPLALLLGGFGWRALAGRAQVLLGVTAAALCLAGLMLAPWYHARFSLRAQLEPLRPLVRDQALVVYSFPKRWDSIAFYLGSTDVRCFDSGGRAGLMCELRQRSQAVVVVKTDRYLADFLRALPEWLEFEEHGSGGPVTAGVVRRRRDIDFTLAAGNGGSALPRAARLRSHEFAEEFADDGAEELSRCQAAGMGGLLNRRRLPLRQQQRQLHDSLPGPEDYRVHSVRFGKRSGWDHVLSMTAWLPTPGPTRIVGVARRENSLIR